jgi:hypothetical protein
MTDTAPNFRPFPHFLKLDLQEDGTYRAKTNTHLIENVQPTEDGFRYVTLPYCGIGSDIEINVEDQDVRNTIVRQMDRQTDLYVFLDDVHPVLKNAYKNYAWMYSNPDKYFSISSIEGMAKGKDILFVGAGPSTNKNLDRIRDICENNKAIVVAGGSAARILCKEGIIPHFLLAFDPRVHEQNVVFQYLTEEWLSQVTAITTPGLFHQCFKSLKKAVVGTTSSINEIAAFLDPEEALLKEGRVGVATMMPHVAEYMACKRLFYIGVDLQFTKDGKRYEDDVDNPNESCNDVIQHKGRSTRVAWMREGVDILNTTDEMPYEHLVLNRDSLLGLLDCKKGKWSQFAKTPKNITINLVPKPNTIEDVKNKLTILKEEFEAMDVKDGWLDPENHRTVAFMTVVSKYHMIQQFRRIRTGDYNSVLLKYVVKNNLRWINEALAGTELSQDEEAGAFYTNVNTGHQLHIAERTKK